MINRTISISAYRDFGITGDTWGTISGLTINNVVEHYTGQTVSNAYVAIIPILLTSTIDDIGFYNPIIESWVNETYYNQGSKVTYDDKTYVCLFTHLSDNVFNSTYWDIIPNNESTGHTVTYTGSPRIDEFRRYGKSNDDIDLYNPIWNTGFTQVTYTSTGAAMRITGEREKLNGFDKQNLYDYDIWVSGKTGTTIHYSDIDKDNSIISYQTSGLTNLNSKRRLCPGTLLSLN